MNDATLQAFRNIADQMIGKADWEWVGPHMSQRMFGITQERAEGYAKSHGGTARQMTPYCAPRHYCEACGSKLTLGGICSCSDWDYETPNR